MNRRGQTLVPVGIMVAFMIFIATVVMIEPMKDILGTGRTDLDCANSSISTGTAMTCIVVDAILPSFIGICFAIGLAFIGARVSGPGQ
jgi:hypothetical protein